MLTWRMNSFNKKIFFSAIFLRFLGTVAFALIYNFYYNGGDTWLYHLDAKLIANTFFQNPKAGLELIFKTPEHYSSLARSYALQSRSGYIFSPNSNLLIRISGFLAILNFKSYIAIALWLSFYAHIGMWLFYKTFTKKYPSLAFNIAISCFFIPSIFFWSGGIMKDTLAFGSVGYLAYAINNLFIDRRKILTSALLLLLNLYIVLNTKSYIAYMFVPATAIWILFSYWDNIKSTFLKIFSYQLLMGIVLIGIVIGIQMLPSLIGQNIEEIVKEIEMTGSWITKVSEKTGGSAYSLGDIDYSVGGLIKAAPKAIFVCLFRPFLWEATNPPMLLSALEALATLLLTIYCFLKIGPFQLIKKSLTNPNVLFCLVFALGFAFFTGISTLNFGSLVRYKLPVFPFYLTALFILQMNNKKASLNNT